MTEKIIKDIYTLLCSKKYNELAKLTDNTQLSSNDIEESIFKYGYELIPYPNDVVFDIVEVINSNPKELSIWAPIYTKEEGLSDLGFELTLIEKNDMTYKVELDNIHVH
jgi:hypothetical protein